MIGRLPENLQEKLSLRLRYYEDIGIREFFRDRIGSAHLESTLEEITPQTAINMTSMNFEGVKTMNESPAPQPLITAIPKIGEGTLQTIREDIGDCIRCKLHKGRTKIVFGDGHPQAKLLFIEKARDAMKICKGCRSSGAPGNCLPR